MFSEHLSKIEGIEIYPIISMIIFISLFLFTLVWVFRLDKKYISKMENLPLDSNLENENKSEIKNEVTE
ncbi:MAG: cytochrome C oxidase Cbb3 [Bacteroidetes bacterium]|nr:cytochrome C oxidase Cbb3 [Bacteroidota bacterium]